MTVRELQLLLAKRNPDAEVVVMLEGSAYKTDNNDEHVDYNSAGQQDFFVLAMEDGW